MATRPCPTGYAGDLAFADEALYVADGLDGVTEFSLAEGMPTFVRSIDTPGFTVGVRVDGSGNLSVADDSSYQVYATAGE